MNFKMIVLASAAALMMGACAHSTHSHEGCKCGAHKEAKKECKGSECALDKKCADCEKAENAPAK